MPDSNPIPVPFPHLRAVTFFALGPSKYLASLRPHARVSAAEFVELKKSEDQYRQFRNIAHSLFNLQVPRGCSEYCRTDSHPSQNLTVRESTVRLEALTLATVAVKEGEFARRSTIGGEGLEQVEATMQVSFQESQDRRDHVFRWEDFLRTSRA